MIQDPAALASIQQQWVAVKDLCTGSHRQFMIPGAGFINETPPETFYNLPFLLAYAVLDQVLDELVAQGTVPRPKGRPLLGTKMTASITALPWKDFPMVDSGKTERNELAHRATLLDREKCFAFIAAIETELKAWSIL
ncbi:MAG TPA: hypothetical protein DD714_04525 [Candidatus Omnitrophica bacterium]|nr:hypothetical protein [Candidatus Omnitrophota bacterium]